MKTWVPLRVDFAGGWLDVPAFAKPGGRIVNCAITPGLSLDDNWVKPGSGLGGSAAWAMLNGKDPVESELASGVGWQDPAVITETGLCVWESGPRPRLEMRSNGEWLAGTMALMPVEGQHRTAELTDRARDLDAIAYAGTVAAEAAQARSLDTLAHAINYSHEAQQGEGMASLPDSEYLLARKYCGAGWGGYALCLFADAVDREQFVLANVDAVIIEPYDRWSGTC